MSRISADTVHTNLTKYTPNRLPHQRVLQLQLPYPPTQHIRVIAQRLAIGSGLRHGIPPFRLQRRHSTGAVQSHPMMHRTGADAKLRRHLLLLHTRQAQFHRATPCLQRYGRLGDGIRIPGIVAQPPYPDTVWSDTPDAPPPASWTSVWRNTTPPPARAPRDRTRQQSFRSVSKKTSAAPNPLFLVPSILSGSTAIIEGSFHRLAPPMPWPME